MNNTRTPLILGLSFVLSIGLIPQSYAQTLLLGYGFNETGTSAAGTGAAATAMSLYNSAGIATDLHSANGGGVSGQSWDRAFDNTAATGMGNVGTGGYGLIPASTIGSVQSFTLTGWFKTDGTTMIGNASKLFEYFTISPTSSGILVNAEASGRLTLNVNGVKLSSSWTGSTDYGATQSWEFFAVTYDGTLSESNVRFYKGTTSTAVSLVSTGTLNAGAVGNPNVAMGIGNGASNNARPFDGLLDEMNLYGSATDGSGVLSLSQLESLRLDAIPEPTVTMLMAMVGGFVFVAALKRKRSATE